MRVVVLIITPRILRLSFIKASRILQPRPLQWAWGNCIKNRSSRKIDSQRLLSREKDFPKTFSLTEYQFSRKTYFYTIGPWFSTFLTLSLQPSPRVRSSPPLSSRGFLRCSLILSYQENCIYFAVRLYIMSRVLSWLTLSVGYDLV